MQETKNKIRSLLKVFLKSLVIQERSIEELAEFLNSNNKILIFNAETRDNLPVSEIGEILGFCSEEQYDKLADELCELIDVTDNLDKKIDDFLKEYNL